MVDRYFDIIFDVDKVDQVPLGNLFETDRRTRNLDRTWREAGAIEDGIRLWHSHNRRGDKESADQLSREIARRFQQSSVDRISASHDARNAGETQLRHAGTERGKEASQRLTDARRRQEKTFRDNERSRDDMDKFFKETNQNPGLHVHPNAPTGEHYHKFNDHINHVVAAYPSSRGPRNGVSVGMSRNPVAHFEDPAHRDQAHEALNTYYPGAVTKTGSRQLQVDALKATSNQDG